MTHTTLCRFLPDKEVPMYKRLELHNHTTESDASLTCRDLLEWMEADRVDAFGLTDHNTISGHPKMEKLLEEDNSGIQCIYGMEYTTYYGHILCLNLREYVPWENIDRRHPELLFEAVRKKGALAGIAHPFSYGYPFARGCRFEMELTDYSCVDFIEVFNNPEPLCEVNEKGLLFWEDLVLKGYPIAMTCGMDLHGRWEMGNQFATYIEGTPQGDISAELDQAVRSQKTCISKGPILEVFMDTQSRSLMFQLIDTKKPGFSFGDTSDYLITLKTLTQTHVTAPGELFPADRLEGAKYVIPKLYYKNRQIENLVCVAPVLHFTGQDSLQWM